MDKRQYIAQLHLLETLPVPGTILYTPADKDKTDGHLLLRWEIDKEGLKATTQCNPHCEITWFPEQVRQCTWDKY